MHHRNTGGDTPAVRAPDVRREVRPLGGLLFTAAIALTAPPVAGLGKDLYLGRRFNPQRGRLDAKMSLYLIGAVMLALNIASFAAHARLAFADPSDGVLLYAALFGFFLVDYLAFEEVHLYTYDFVAERVGFKLGWGCLAFYPYFYAIGLWSEAAKPSPHAPAWLSIGAAALFLGGWSLSRGANLQKFRFKTHPGANVPRHRAGRGERRSPRAPMQRVLARVAPRQLPRRARHGRGPHARARAPARSGAVAVSALLPRAAPAARARRRSPLPGEVPRAVRAVRIVPGVY